MKTSRRYFYCPALLLASAAAAASASTPVFSNDFESDPSATWGVTGAVSPTPTSAWTTEAADSGTHSLKVQDGMWNSWYYNTDPFSYYLLTANIKSNGNSGFWGTTINNQVPYPSSPDWTPVAYAFRSGPKTTDIIQAQFGSVSPGPAYVDDVSLSKISRAEAKQTLNNYYATLPAYDFTQSVRTHAQDQLPATIAKLRAGQDVNCVMLGDSIVGDTSNSFWETQLDGQYPGKVNVTTSIRSTTGCWYYKDPAILNDYVLKYNPDLVIIGGISHDGGGITNDTQDIASVIDQIRAHNPNTEILLLTETSSTNNPYTNPSLANPVDPSGTDWRAALYQLSQQEHTAFLDMTEGWADYILNSGLPYNSFLRDPIHDNSVGESVIGRTLATYFAPTPEPATLSLFALPTLALLRRRRA